MTDKFSCESKDEQTVNGQSTTDNQNMANILIIDDEDDIRKLLSRIVRLEGYTFFQAETGTKGLKLISKEKIHAVICEFHVSLAKFSLSCLFYNWV